MSVATRRLKISGEEGLDYKVDGVNSAIYLYTADKEQLKKGSTYKVTLTSTVQTSDRVLVVRPNPELVYAGPVTGINIIRSGDSGEIVLWATPKSDIDLGSLDYICEILVEA